MNNLDFDSFASLPGACHFQPNCVSGFPFNVEITDAWAKVGSGIGNEDNALQTALGEYFERRHFYMEILSDEENTLDQTLSSDEIQKFARAFVQTSLCDIEESLISKHSFRTSTAHRISDFTQCQIPTILISLSYHNLEEDTHFYPSRDTCGCSFHRNYENSIYGAIKETMERQFLIRFWLTKKCLAILAPQKFEGKFKNTSTYSLYNALKKSGHIEALDISDPNFPGHCVLIVYGNDKEDCNVSYCAGMSYAETIEQAFEKSVLELWQTFRFMNLFYSLNTCVSTIKDRYLLHFLKSNNFQTFNEITDVIITHEKSKRPRDALNLQTLIGSFINLNMQGYLYTKPVWIAGENYIYCKFFSPSLFLHMDSSSSINLDNDYSRQFIKDIYSTRKSIMVPFP
ncbi:YcaO-like family protein [Pseudomonas syringae]|uniref:YcaO-like family protein n=1 Tax=Pseudomonas syringae TaxID=317 RepID=UPI003F756D69